jgi:hypothetical protein
MPQAIQERAPRIGNLAVGHNDETDPLARSCANPAMGENAYEN